MDISPTVPAERDAREPEPMITRLASDRTAVVMGSGSRLRRARNDRSVMILEALGELVDILRRPARNFHPEMQAHLRQHFLDLIERLAAEIGRAQHLGLG